MTSHTLLKHLLLDVICFMNELRETVGACLCFIHFYGEDPKN